MNLEHIKATASKRKTVFRNQAGEVHDRSNYVGGSEAFGCQRRLWLDKHGASQDKGYTKPWGNFERGHLIEDWAVGLIRETYPTAQYLYTGQDQTTLIYQRLAVTPDGLIVRKKHPELVVEIKSLDPRSNMDKPKAAHVLQAELQIEMFHRCTDHRPSQAVLVYVNASDFSDMRLHWVERNPPVLDAAIKRAEAVFSAARATDLIGEGAISGDCQYCQFTTACGDAVVREFPTDTSKEAPAEIADQLSTLAKRKSELSNSIDLLTAAKGQVDAEIKQLLRQTNLKSVQAGGYSISYTLVAGRKTLDIEAAQDAGLDLSPYWKEGHSSERLTVKSMSK